MASVVIKTEDPHEICRLCLSEESLNYVFEEEDIPQLISDYLSITISVEDSLSQYLCAICKIRLTEFHQFRINCQEAQIVQQSMLKNRDFAVEESNLESQIQEQRQDDPNYDLPEIKKSPLYLESCSEESPDGTVQEFKREKYTIFDYGEHGDQQSFSLENIVDIQNVKNEPYTDNDFELSAQSSSDWEQTVQGKADVTKKKSYECGTCHKIFPCRNTLCYHKKRAHETLKHNCSTCGIGFVFQSHLTLHLQSKQHAERLNPTPVPDDPSKPYKCEICHKGFKMQCRLTEHKKSVHEPKSHVCPVCDLKFCDRSAMRKHFKKHYPDNSDALSQFAEVLKPVPKKVKLKEVDTNSTVRSFKCDLCPKTFKGNNKLTRHKKLVHGPKTYSCELCDFKSCTGFNLDRHKRLHARENQKDTISGSCKAEDSSDRPFRCDLCPSAFTGNTKLTKHKKQVHRPKDHSCRFCDFNCYSRFNVDRHERLHCRGKKKTIEEPRINEEDKQEGSISGSCEASGNDSQIIKQETAD